MIKTIISEAGKRELNRLDFEIDTVLAKAIEYVPNEELLIQYVGIAQTVFHEVGHHVERIRSHGIKKKMSLSTT